MGESWHETASEMVYSTVTYTFYNQRSVFVNEKHKIITCIYPRSSQQNIVPNEYDYNHILSVKLQRSSNGR